MAVCKFHSLKVALAFASSIALFSCSLPALEHKYPRVNPLKVGDGFKINLAEEHTNGYSWQLNDNFDKNLIKELNAVWHGNEKGIDFNFKALAAGVTTITLVKRKFADTAEVSEYVLKIMPKD